MQSNFFTTDDGQIGGGLCILSIVVIGVFAYRRGRHKTPAWLRLYIWCAVVVEAPLWLMTGYFEAERAGKAGPVISDAGPLAYTYLVTVFVAQYVVVLGVVIASILLVVLIVEASRSVWSALVR
jgi:uncharacterized protein (DUF983 family)